MVRRQLAAARRRGDGSKWKRATRLHKQTELYSGWKRYIKWSNEPLRSATQLACISTFASILFQATIAQVASFSRSPRLQTSKSHTLVSGSLRQTISISPGCLCKCSIPHIDARIPVPRATQQITGSNVRSALSRPAGAADRSHALVSLLSTNCISEGWERSPAHRPAPALTARSDLQRRRI